MRFGIGVNDALTLDEIGTRFEVTRERIRQIEAKAIRKLQHVSRSEPFARMVLGLGPEENPLAPRARRHSETAEPSKPSALDQLLTKAVELGIPVIDERQSAGSIWVELLEPRDNKHRRLIHKLLDSGFAFLPGKGYWK